MNEGAKPRVFASIRLGLHDTLAVARAMPVFFAATAAALVAETAGEEAFWRAYPDAGWPAAGLAGSIDMIVYSLFLTPLSVAIYRFVILHERSTPTSLVRLQPVLVDSFILLAIFNVIGGLPFSVTWGGPYAEGSEAFIAGSVISLGLWMAALRLASLFPAVAVQGEGSSLRGAARLMKGLVMRLAAIVAIVILPLGVLSLAPLHFVQPGAEGDQLLSPLLGGLFETIANAFMIAVTARFYVWRTGKPPSNGQELAQDSE